jgi:isopentenyl phosphate kinase
VPENVEEKVVEMSKNAQFRAIQPSSSILSFVEDNVCNMLHNIKREFHKEQSPVLFGNADLLGTIRTNLITYVTL